MCMHSCTYMYVPSYVMYMVYMYVFQKICEVYLLQFVLEYTLKEPCLKFVLVNNECGQLARKKILMLIFGRLLIEKYVYSLLVRTTIFKAARRLY